MNAKAARHLRLPGVLAAAALGLLSAYGVRRNLAAHHVPWAVVCAVLTVLSMAAVVLVLPSLLHPADADADADKGAARSEVAGSLDLLRYVWGIGLCGSVAVTIAAPDHPATGVLVMGAFMLVGGVVGFLFGIPRTSGGDTVPVPDVAAKDAGPAGGAPRAADGAYRLRPNTNLEQISDWLTKIIVGVGLVECKQVPAALSGLAHWLARGVGAADGKGVEAVQPFVLGTVLYSLAFGFLAGYLLTRLQLQRAFREADQAAFAPIVVAKRIVGEVPLRADPHATPPLTPGQKDAVREVASRPLEALRSPPDLAAWAKAKLTMEDLAEARRGYERALQSTPNDPKVLGEYSIVLFRMKPRDVENRRVVLRTLERARDAIVAATPPEVVHRIFVDLTYHALYLPPPEGYTQAIAYATDYNGRRRKLASGEVWLNLACAWGQKFADPAVTERAGIREHALDAFRTALALDPALTEQARRLLGLGSEGSEASADQDLRPFLDDPEFRKLTGVPPTVDGGASRTK